MGVCVRVCVRMLLVIEHGREVMQVIGVHSCQYICDFTGYHQVHSFVIVLL